jgi:hypothetical protein
MNVKLPVDLTDLITFLEIDCGFYFEKEYISPNFDDAIIFLRNKHIRIRFVRDRSNWCIEMNYDKQENEWYDISLIKEVLNEKEEHGVLGYIEQSDFIKNNWDKIVFLFDEENVQNLIVSLNYARNERAKRTFPKWYQ